MESTEFIEKLREYAAAEDVLAVSREVSELRSKFDDYVLEEERKFQVSQLEAQERGESVPELETDFGKEVFYELYDGFRAARKEQESEKRQVESKNLAQKRALITRLESIVTSEENIGAAFAAFKEIQDQWKEIGDIPRDQRNDIQKEYSKLLEDFFYNINIYKQLKDHDFHRNEQLKHQVIQELKGLQREESVKEIETKLKQLQNDWEDIGPVHNEEWERMKEAYWTEVRSIYNRINRFYEDRRSEQRENIEKKQALITEVSGVMQEQSAWETSKHWEDATQKILDVQERWKQVGFGPRKENEEVWRAFRGVCDSFFEAKKSFFSEINDQFDAVADKKKALIAKAEELSTSTDWKETSNKLIQLQKQWKQLGHAGRKNEQKLWKSFRAACDAFFDSKTKHFEGKDKEFEVNLEKKQELLKTIEAYQVPEDKKEALAELTRFSNEFNAIGRVPLKEKDNVYNAFKKAMDQHYGQLKMEGQEKEKVMFLAKIETLKASPNAGRLLGDLKMDMRREIDKHQKEIVQLENNLGFFANSKGAEALKKDVEKKVQRAKDQIVLIRDMIKLIPNE